MKVKKSDGSVQIHSTNLLYPLELSLTHAHQPSIIPYSEESIDGEVNISNSDLSNQVSDSMMLLTRLHNILKRPKTSKVNEISPMIFMYTTKVNIT